MKGEIEKAKQLLSGPSQVVLLTHTRPDGDAVASLLASCISLNAAGYEVFGILSEGIPNRYSFLPGLEFVSSNIPNQVELIIALDCADEDRLGVPPEKLPRTVDINIDHHVSNTNFGIVNIVDIKAVSTTQILYDLLKNLGFPIHLDVAINLLTGLVTDTIGFRTENVSAQVMILAAELQELGASLSQIQRKALHQRTFAEVRYWGCGLSRLSQENGVVWTTLQHSDREKAGYSGYDDADLINVMSTIENARVAVILIEQPGGKIKVSWRSQSGFNVAHLAETFGGGGHKAAAGAVIMGDLEGVTSTVLSATFELANALVELGE